MRTEIAARHCSRHVGVEVCSVETCMSIYSCHTPSTGHVAGSCALQHSTTARPPVNRTIFGIPRSKLDSQYDCTCVIEQC